MMRKGVDPGDMGAAEAWRLSITIIILIRVSFSHRDGVVQNSETGFRLSACQPQSLGDAWMDSNITFRYFTPYEAILAPIGYLSGAL